MAPRSRAASRKLVEDKHLLNGASPCLARKHVPWHDNQPIRIILDIPSTQKRRPRHVTKTKPFWSFTSVDKHASSKFMIYQKTWNYSMRIYQYTHIRISQTYKGPRCPITRKTDIRRNVRASTAYPRASGAHSPIQMSTGVINAPLCTYMHIYDSASP